MLTNLPVIINSYMGFESNGSQIRIVHSTPSDEEFLKELFNPFVSNPEAMYLASYNPL